VDLSLPEERALSSSRFGWNTATAMTINNVNNPAFRMLGRIAGRFGGRMCGGAAAVRVAREAWVTAQSGDSSLPQNRHTRAAGIIISAQNGHGRRTSGGSGIPHYYL